MLPSAIDAVGGEHCPHPCRRVEPCTLMVSFFTFAGGEAGVLGMLKHSDNRYSEKNEPKG